MIEVKIMVGKGKVKDMKIGVSIISYWLLYESWDHSNERQK